MDPLTDLSDILILSDIDQGLNEGKDLRMILAEMIAKFTSQLARTLGKQGMPDPFLAMVPATFGALQMQIGWLICQLDDNDSDDDKPLSTDDPLVQEFMEKLQPVADMVNGLIERMQNRN